MIRVYRGYKIEAWRETSLGGWDNVYFYVSRLSDGLMLIDEFTGDLEPVRGLMEALKRRVDKAIETKGASECIEEELWRDG